MNGVYSVYSLFQKLLVKIGCVVPHPFVEVVFEATHVTQWISRVDPL